jgi:hypothetical protein
VRVTATSDRVNVTATVPASMADRAMTPPDSCGALITLSERGGRTTFQPALDTAGT